MRRGLKHGIPQDRLDRMTTVVLKKLLTHDKPSSVRSSEAKKKETKERISEDRLRSRPSGPDDDDRHEDNQTVVDLAYAEEAANPADKYYRRLRSLVQFEHKLEEAVKTNVAVLRTLRSDLDTEDIKAVEDEIRDNQEKLGLIDKEKLEIQHFLQEFVQQRVAFYRERTPEFMDPTGHLNDFFEKKIQNLLEYLQAMREMDGRPE